MLRGLGEMFSSGGVECFVRPVRDTSSIALFVLTPLCSVRHCLSSHDQRRAISKSRFKDIEDDARRRPEHFVEMCEAGYTRQTNEAHISSTACRTTEAAMLFLKAFIEL